MHAATTPLLRTLLSCVFACFCSGAPKKVVFLTADDLKHASGTHEFEAGAILLKNSLHKAGYKDKLNISLVNNWSGDKDALKDADLLIHYYRGNQFHLLNDHQTFIQKLVEQGTSQLFIHYAVDPDTPCEPSLKNWTGAVYQDQYSANPFWTLNSQLQNHPINNGVKNYSSYDEWYMRMSFEDRVQIGYEQADQTDTCYCVMHGTEEDFKTAKGNRTKNLPKTLSASDLTVFWAKELTSGSRGAAVTGAHFHKNWANDEFRKQVLNAIVWCAKLPVPKAGVNSPAITEKEINRNLDPRKIGGLKKITLPKTQPAKKENKGRYQTKKKIQSVIESLHPYFALENLDTLGNDSLKIGAMCFKGDSLFVATLSPDRLNRSPDHKGKILRIDHALEADGRRKKIKATTLVTGLYEPTAIAIIDQSLYVGTKTQILRFDNATHTKAPLKTEDAIVLADGLSTVNFHTYTIGFEKVVKDGATYLCGNLTTAIIPGGRRDRMIPPNPNAKRGSTFLFGPVTSNESATDASFHYLAGGFRTPNGLEVGPNDEIYVADNQGIFNPSNELVRIEPGSFYGHYLYTKNGRASAFQPQDIDPIKGNSSGQSPATIHLPQGNVARSPSQPHVIQNRTDILKPYNGQILLCDFTTGSLLRIATEQVEGIWQGAAFKHSGGLPDQDGNGGFTGGPNRILVGPDGHYYIGQIGAGGLWEFNGARHGLQRLRVKTRDEVDAKFNEILTVKVVEGGFELKFLKPLSPESISAEDIKVSQWTYIPTSNYGGPPIGLEKLTVQKLTFDTTSKTATLLIDGLKDGRPQYEIKKGSSSSANTGWVVHIQFDPQDNGQSLLYTKEFWYTLHRKLGGRDLADDEVIKASSHELMVQKYESLCLSCHVPRGGVWAAPDLKNLLGRKQDIIRNGEVTQVTVDRNYIINSILNPEAEKPVQFKDGVMAPLGLSRKEAEQLADYIISAGS